ncbi:hypothetical protein F442_06332, partial [Phytophthora nicotianae P10297]
SARTVVDGLLGRKKKASKVDRIALLNENDTVKLSRGANKTTNDVLGLLNVMFDDFPVDEMGLLGAARSRQQLGASDIAFWMRVVADFHSDLPVFGRLAHEDIHF